MDNAVLCFIKLVGRDKDDLFLYDFYFTKTPDEFFGEDFGELPASLCHDLTPYTDTYDEVYRIKTDIELILIQNSTSFSVQDCIDGCVSMAYEDITQKEYPDYRLVLQFGDTKEVVREKLERKDVQDIGF